MNEFNTHKAKKRLRDDIKRKSWTIQQDGCPDSLVTLYVYDPLVSKHSMLHLLNREHIQAMQDIKADMPLITNTVGTAFDNYLAATPKQIKKTSDYLGVAAALYMVNTQTFGQLMAVKQPHMHFIVLLYRNKYVTDFFLRPFSLVHSEQILSPSQLAQASLPVIKRDERVNPHYFQRAPVVQMR